MLRRHQTQSNDAGINVSQVYGPEAYAVQPGGAVHSEVNAGSGELVALVLLWRAG